MLFSLFTLHSKRGGKESKGGFLDHAKKGKCFARDHYLILTLTRAKDGQAWKILKNIATRLLFFKEANKKVKGGCYGLAGGKGIFDPPPKRGRVLWVVL